MKRISLTRGEFAIVDNEDFEWLNQWRWYCDAYGYAIRKPYIRGTGRKHQKGLSIRMHRLINKTPKGLETDHINRNTLDNRKINLRTVSSQQNKFNTNIRIDNTSGYKGVTWDKQTNKWMSQIGIDGKNIKLGRYFHLKEAIDARENAEEVFHVL